MNVLDRRRTLALLLVASAVACGLARAQGPAPARPRGAAASAPAAEPTLKEVRVPVNATDPIATVNGEVITRQQLADECVAREGQKILQTLINRRLIEQAIRAQKFEITPEEIDREIDRVAQATAGVDREVWLRNLDKEKGISPAQYARDIIYPALALRKLAEKRVQVTEQDIKDAFEANFGPRLRCRIIMVKDMRTASQIWEELRKNPAGFERIAKVQSLDHATRSAGGMLPDPIARHAYPRNVSDPAFAQLVDGNPNDKDGKGQPIKPKDGEITGPIQVNEDAWIIMKREEVIEPLKAASPTDVGVREMLRAQMFDVKLNDAMQSFFEELVKASTIDNKLTGQVRTAHEEREQGYREGLDTKIQRMSAAGETQAVAPTGGRSPANVATSPAGAARPPAGLDPGAAKAAASLQQAIKASPKAAPKN